MDTNFNLNLLLILILAILYCFRDSDLKSDNFENFLIDNFQNTVESEEETSDLNKKFNELEKKYKNKQPPKNNKMDEYQNQLMEAQKEAELEAEKSTSNTSNKKKKVKKNSNTIIKPSNYYVKQASSNDSFVDTESLDTEFLDSKQNNPPNNLPQPQNLNTTVYGLFNKHNLPPSSRPNVIDIFNNTEPSMESDIVQHSFKGDGNIFLPKVYV